MALALTGFTIRRMAAPHRFWYAGRHRVSAAWKAPWHRHRNAEALVILGGRLRVRRDDGHVDVHAGQVLIHAPHRGHAEQALGPGCDFVYLGFAGEAAAEEPLVDADGRLRLLAQWLAADATAPDRHEADLADLLRTFLAGVRRAGRGVDGWLQAVRQRMTRRMTEPLRLADLAAGCGLSPATFVRRYRRHSGESPMRDLRRLRAEAVAQLLATTDLPLHAIAVQVGLQDESHLSRVFCACLGMRPGAYRERLRGRGRP